MKNLVRLTEGDLIRIVRRVINESENSSDSISQNVNNLKVKDFTFLMIEPKDPGYDEFYIKALIRKVVPGVTDAGIKKMWRRYSKTYGEYMDYSEEDFILLPRKEIAQSARKLILKLAKIAAEE